MSSRGTASRRAKGAPHPRAADRSTSAASPREGGAERVTRRQAAERLTDLAYALMVGGPLELGDGEAAGQVPDELEMKRVTTAQGARVAFQVELSWSGSEEPENRRPRRS